MLMTDYAQELRRHEGLTPFEAIRKAASLARPADHDDRTGRLLRLDSGRHGHRAAAARPMPRWPGRFWAGLLAGEPATLFVLPVIYTLLVRGFAQATSRAGRAAGGGA